MDAQSDKGTSKLKLTRNRQGCWSRITRERKRKNNRPDHDFGVRSRQQGGQETCTTRSVMNKSCPYCDNQYHRNKIAVHLMETHYRVLEEDAGFPLCMIRKLWARDTVDLSCGVCEIDFTEKLEYKRHLGSHFRLLCLVCDNVFTHYESLVNHMKKHESVVVSSETEASSSQCSEADRTGGVVDFGAIKVIKKIGKSPSSTRKQQRFSPTKAFLNDDHKVLARSDGETALFEFEEPVPSNQHIGVQDDDVLSSTHSDVSSAVFDDARSESSSECHNEEFLGSSVVFKLKDAIVMLTRSAEIDKLCESEAITFQESEDSQSSDASCIESEKNDKELCSPSGILVCPSPPLPALSDSARMTEQTPSHHVDLESPRNIFGFNSLVDFDDETVSSNFMSASDGNMSPLVRLDGESKADLYMKLGPGSCLESSGEKNVYSTFTLNEKSSAAGTAVGNKPQAKRGRKHQRMSSNEFKGSTESERGKNKDHQRGKRVCNSLYEIKKLKCDLLNSDVDLPQKRAIKRVNRYSFEEAVDQDACSEGSRKLKHSARKVSNKSSFRENSANRTESCNELALKLEMFDNEDGPRASVDVKLIENPNKFGECGVSQKTTNEGNTGTSSVCWVQSADGGPTCYSDPSVTNPKYKNILELNSNHSGNEETSVSTKRFEDVNVQRSAQHSLLYDGFLVHEAPKLVNESRMASSVYKPTHTKTSPNKLFILGSWTSKTSDCEKEGHSSKECSPDPQSLASNEFSHHSHLPDVPIDVYQSGCEKICSRSDIFKSVDTLEKASPDIKGLTLSPIHKINWGSDTEDGSLTVFEPDYDDVESSVSLECLAEPNHHGPNRGEKEGKQTSGEVALKAEWGFGSDIEGDGKSTQPNAFSPAKVKNKSVKKSKTCSYSSWEEKRRHLDKILQQIEEHVPTIATPSRSKLSQSHRNVCEFGGEVQPRHSMGAERAKCGQELSDKGIAVLPKETSSHHVGLLSKKTVTFSASCGSSSKHGIGRYVESPDTSKPGHRRRVRDTPRFFSQLSPSTKSCAMSSDSSDLLRTENGSPSDSPELERSQPRSYSPIYSDNEFDL